MYFAAFVFALSLACSYTAPQGTLLDDRIGKEKYAKVDSTRVISTKKPIKKKYLIDDRIGKERVVELGNEELVIPDSLVIAKDVMPPENDKMLKTVNYGGNIFGCDSEKEVVLKIVKQAKDIGANYVILINILPPTEYINGFRCDAEFYKIKGGLPKSDRYFSVEAINKRTKDAKNNSILNSLQGFLYLLY